MFRRFLKGRLGDYDANRNQPPTNHVSHMSKYLHFGHISPIWLALEARKANAKEDYIESFVEELVVRRELSVNFDFYNRVYNRDYDSCSNLPGWAKETLERNREEDPGVVQHP